MIPCQSVKFPHGAGVKFAAFSRCAHLLKAFSIQAPAILGAILVYADNDTALLRHQLAADCFLVLQANFILHFG